MSMKTIELVARAKQCTKEPPDDDVVNKALWLALKNDIQTTAMIVTAKYTTPTKIMFKEILTEYIKNYD